MLREADHDHRQGLGQARGQGGCGSRVARAGCDVVWLQGRIDTYFKRMADIIKKGKIPARIKFMLQDVQEMRDNVWVPRVRQDKQLKTIDQVSLWVGRGGGQP